MPSYTPLLAAARIAKTSDPLPPPKAIAQLDRIIEMLRDTARKRASGGDGAQEFGRKRTSVGEGGKSAGESAVQGGKKARPAVQ
jgi:hypothetical protein